MAQTKNLCAQIPIALHTQVCEAREQSGLTTAEYITNLLIEYFEMKENGGKTIMANNTRTMAFQIPEDLFQMMDGYSAWHNPPARCPAIGRRCTGLLWRGPGRNFLR